VRFNTHVGDMMQKYTGEGNPTDHVAQCEKAWSSVPKKEWTHRFIHILDTIPKNWYLEMEMCRETID
jgi:hypothetical protein